MARTTPNQHALNYPNPYFFALAIRGLFIGQGLGNDASGLWGSICLFVKNASVSKKLQAFPKFTYAQSGKRRGILSGRS